MNFKQSDVCCEFINVRVNSQVCYVGKINVVMYVIKVNNDPKKQWT